MAKTSCDYCIYSNKQQNGNIIETFFHLQTTGLFIRNVQPHSCLSGVLKLKDQLIKVR